MGIGEQERVEKTGTTNFWLVTTLLFIGAAVLRWWRLDLMSFNFDQAAICERAMELFDGRIPFTGIVNSLGFRNAPGYVWSLLPAFLITCNPLVATAWHGLLCASIVFPLALIGQRFRRDGLMWLPAIFAAFLPAEILAGRTLWAQYLVTPLSAWGLWTLICALDERRPLAIRQRFGSASLALIAWAVSVHYGAAPALLIATVSLWRLFRNSGRGGRIALLTPVVIILLSMLPSVIDFFYRLSNPLPKPAYALKFEAELPEPLPQWARISQAASASLLNSSRDVPALDFSLPTGMLNLLGFYDAIVGLCVSIGLIFCLWQLLGRRNVGDRFSRTTVALLLIWIVVPVLTGGLFLKRVQPSYFAAALPAGWLAILFLPSISKSFRILRMVPYVVALIIITGGTWTVSEFLRVLSTQKIVAANYYVPFRWEMQIVDYLRNNAVTGERIHHLSGPIFEKAYVYLTDCRAEHEDDEVGTKQNYAVLVDRAFIKDTPGRLAFLLESRAVEIGPALIKILPSRGAADIFTRQYYALRH